MRASIGSAGWQQANSSESRSSRLCGTARASPLPFAASCSSRCSKPRPRTARLSTMRGAADRSHDSGDGRQPGAGTARNPVAPTRSQCAHQGILHAVLGEIPVARDRTRVETIVADSSAPMPGERQPPSLERRHGTPAARCIARRDIAPPRARAADRADLDLAELRHRMPRRNLNRVIQIRAIQQVESRDVVLRLDERTIDQRDLPIAHAARSSHPPAGRSRLPARRQPRRPTSAHHSSMLFSSARNCGAVASVQTRNRNSMFDHLSSCRSADERDRDRRTPPGQDFTGRAHHRGHNSPMTTGGDFGRSGNGRRSCRAARRPRAHGCSSPPRSLPSSA